MELQVEKSSSSRYEKALIMYFMLKPLYLFDSGLPQLCDFFLVGYFLFLLVKNNFRIPIAKRFLRWVKLFMLLCIFQFVVNLIWFIICDDIQMMVKSLYYFFNLLAVLACFMTYNQIGYKRFLIAVSQGCFLSAIVTALGLTLSIGSKTRATGFFNNPNQLGYYALLLLTLKVFFSEYLIKWKRYIVFAIVLWANLESLSKASIIGLAGMAFLWILFGQEEKKKAKTLLIQIALLFGLFGIVYWFFFSNSAIIMSNRTLFLLQRRLLSIGKEADSDLGSGRGYARVLEMGVHMFWGLGEGAFDRFVSLPGHEVHSTYVSLLVSYGLVGFGGYIYLFMNAIKQKGRTLRNYACFSGLLLYFITHNGIRNTMLWILLASMLIEKEGYSSLVLEGKKHDIK